MPGNDEMKDWLDERLSQLQPHVDDNGFCARVMTHLPPPGRSSEKLRASVLFASTVAAGVIAWPGVGVVFKALTHAPATAFTHPLALCAMALLLLAGFGALAAAISD